MSIFIQDALPPDLLAGFIRQYGEDISAGAYSCFMGQVRGDVVDGKNVKAIEFTAYPEMADEQMLVIAAQVKKQFGLKGLEVRHSLGTVMTGGICLFVLTVSAHRKAAMEACNLLVERVKKELPVWGKEILEGEQYQWKTNQ
jgi:molybdopterin synthase catalytic subunit